MPIASQDVSSPFKFLDAYTKKDGEIFFGRDAEIEQLYQSVNKNRIVLVYGQSGTGKTSLVQCGLSNRFEVTDWVPFWIRRGKNINESLYQAISQSKALGGASVDDRNLFQSLERLSKRYVRPVYLIFDQFEELLLLGEEPEKELFLETIKEVLSREQTEACHLLFIIREEYFGWLESFETAIPGFSDRRLRVEPMRPDRLDEVILQSCAAFNIQLEDPAANTQKIRQSLRTKGGIALPYLQVYLDQLYREDYVRTYPDGWTGKGYPPLRFESQEVEQMGVISDILERLLYSRRETIQQELEAKFPNIDTHFVERVLDGFVTFEGTKRPVNYTRHPQGVRLSEKAPQDLQNLPKEPLAYCLEALENNRLLRADEDTFELAHDSLAALIDRQRSDEQRRINEVYRQIRHSYQIFQETETDYLSRNQLALYETYLPKLDLDPELATFIEKSRRHLLSTEEADRQKLIEERQLRELAEKNARRAKKRTRVVAILAVLVPLAAFWGIWQLAQTRQAREDIAAQMVETQSAALVARSRKVFFENENLAWRLAAVGYELSPTPQTALALRDMSNVISPAVGIIPRHTAKISALQFSPDSKQLISVGSDNTIRISAEGQPESHLISWGYRENSPVSLSRGGQFAAIALSDTVQVWNLQSRALTWQKIYNNGFVSRLAIDPDGVKVAIGHSRGEVDLFDVAQDSLISSIPVNGGVRALSFSSDGNALATSGQDDRPTLWGIAGNLITTYPFELFVSTLVFSPDGELLAGGDEGGDVRIWHRDGRLYKVLEGGNLRITDIAFSPDRSEVLASDYQGYLMRWNLQSGTRLEAIRLAEGQAVNAVAYTPDGRQFFGTDNWGNILVWDRDMQVNFSGEQLPVITAVSQLDTNRFVTGDQLGNIRLVSKDIPPRLVDTMEGEISTLDVSPDGQWIGAGNHFGDIKLIPVTGGTGKHFNISDAEIATLQFSPDGQYLLTTHPQDQMVRLLALNGEVKKAFGGNGEEQFAAAHFSPDGKRVFATTYQGLGILYDINGGELQRGFDHERYFSNVGDTYSFNVSADIFSPDGQRLITGGEDGAIKVWSLDGTELNRFGTGNSAVAALDISPQGFLAAYSNEGLIDIWTLDGSLIQTFQAPQLIPGLAFSADGRYLLSSGLYGVPDLIPLWHTILENQTVSRIDLYNNGALGEEEAMGTFLDSNLQTELVAYAQFFIRLYHNNKDEEHLDQARQLYEKALSAEFTDRQDALSGAWWRQHFRIIPGDAPTLVKIRELFEELRYH